MKSGRILIVTMVVVFIVYCGSVLPSRQCVKNTERMILGTDSISPEKAATPVITYEIITGINKTWGYDILVNDRVKIHQPSVPGLPGNEGFRTREGAEKVVRLVIKKMKTGEMPPSVTYEEMKKLNVL